MRIALITDSFLPAWGGLEWKVHYLASEYSQHGHDVTVFAGRRTRTLKPIPIPVEHDYKLIRCGFPMRGFSRLGVMRHLFCRQILKCQRQIPFDVLHCHHLGIPTQIGCTVKQVSGVPTVATPCGVDIQVDPEINYGIRLVPYQDKIVRSNLKQLDVVGCISSSVRADIESLGTSAALVDIPNGVLWENFQIDRVSLLRDRIGIGAEEVLILSVGRNHIKKGYQAGIKAFSHIASEYPMLHYAIVGHNTSQFGPLVETLGLQGRVHLVEAVPMSEMPAIYHSADVFFNPSLLEGFAQVNAQAMSSGLPCVLTDAPGNYDAGNYGGALIAKSGDEESMAMQLKKLVADKTFREKLGHDAHRASVRFSWKTIAESYLDVFEGLVSGNRP